MAEIVDLKDLKLVFWSEDYTEYLKDLANLIEEAGRRMERDYPGCLVNGNESSTELIKFADNLWKTGIKIDDFLNVLKEGFEEDEFDFRTSD